MSKEQMFFCIPQQAYMQVSNCGKLRERPVGKVPAGSQPKLRACETCTMYPLVDKKKVPTVSLQSYLEGDRPNEVNLDSTSVRKVIKAHFNRLAG